MSIASWLNFSWVSLLNLGLFSSPVNPYQGDNLPVVKKPPSEPERKIEIPVDVLREIFHYLEDKELAQVSMTCHIWKKIIDTQRVLNLKRRGFYKTCIFGKEHWNKYFGDVGKALPLPKDIGKILQSRCPFWRDRKVHQTNLLVLIPKRVNGAPLTLNSLQKLITKPQGGGRATKYKYYNNAVKKELGNAPAPTSHWVLMTKDVIPNSRSKSYADQCTLAQKLQKRTGIAYELPSALEATVAILMHHAKSGERLYSDKPLTYTRCQEKVDNNKYHVAIGRFGAGGFAVFHDVSWDRDFHGIGVFRCV